MPKRSFLAVLVPVFLSLFACDDITSTDDASPVTLGFSIAPVASALPDAGVSSSVVAADEHEYTLPGDNGTLTITDIAFIVDEFKLVRDDASCQEIEGDEEDDDGCETFETGPVFVELQLDGAETPVVTQGVPAGTYVALKLETADVDLAEATDDEESAEITTLIGDIEEAGFSEWPADASLVVVGSFTDPEGTRDFTAYFKGEIKVEMDLPELLVIDGESGTVDVEIDPAAWYVNPDNTVIDLSDYDYATTNEVVEFEAKMVHGFSKVELEGFND